MSSLRSIFTIRQHRPAAGQSLIKHQGLHAGLDPAPAPPALTEVGPTVLLVPVPVLLTAVVPGAGVPLGGGGGRQGGYPALLLFPGLNTLELLRIPHPGLSAIPD